MNETATTPPVLEVHALALGVIETNCYIVADSVERRAFVVDPGAEADRVVAHARARDLRIEGILITHCHWDHIGAVAALARELRVPVWASEIEAPVIRGDLDIVQGPEPIEPAPVDHTLGGGERIVVAGVALDVVLTPGHSPGSMTFVVPGIPDASGDGFEQPPIAFVGDVIFRGSVGRTDLPMASGEQLANTLQNLVRRLEPETILLSGHGAPTTMGDERASNPFLRGVG